MALQTTVACRRAFPPGRGQWTIELASKGTDDIDEGELVAWSVDLDDPEEADFIASVARVTGLAMARHVFPRPPRSLESTKSKAIPSRLGADGGRRAGRVVTGGRGSSPPPVS
jgi:hypothetical protein